MAFCLPGQRLHKDWQPLVVRPWTFSCWPGMLLILEPPPRTGVVATHPSFLDADFEQRHDLARLVCMPE
jgi:hypothetical protein